MTDDPHQESNVGGEPTARPSDPPSVPHADTDREVITGPGGSPGPGLRQLWRRRSVRARAVAAAATVVVLAVGGVAYAASSGGSGGGPGPAASGSASPSPGGPGERHGHGMWFGFGGAGVHGEATVKDRDTGEWVVRIWQRGTVEKADGDQVTVKSEDGASWTWTVSADTRVFGDGTPDSGADALTKGETAYLVGSRSDDGTRTATHVLSGTWKDKGPDSPDDDWRDRLPGHGPRDWRGPDPSASPQDSGATA
jgi:hypothetical protein